MSQLLRSESATKTHIQSPCAAIRHSAMLLKSNTRGVVAGVPFKNGAAAPKALENLLDVVKSSWQPLGGCELLLYSIVLRISN